MGTTETKFRFGAGSYSMKKSRSKTPAPPKLKKTSNIKSSTDSPQPSSYVGTPEVPADGDRADCIKVGIRVRPFFSNEQYVVKMDTSAQFESGKENSILQSW